MQFAFRTDASLQIGTGHVMRCLTLADALRVRGAQSTFLCRPHAGHLLDLIRQRGHTVMVLPSAENAFTEPAELSHAEWLGTDWACDAEQTRQALGDQVVDWLVVDHYALDSRWEHALAPHYRKLMVIDDLADRPHSCDLLLDQTFNRDAADYRPLVPAACRLVCGTQYALLRPEFADLRAYSLKRRAQPSLREVLINMGGVDKDNLTEQVLQAVRTCPLPADCHITVVMGMTAPWLNEVRTKAQDMPWQTRVLVGVNNMAQLMADSDLAIGAAGATSWERCCLGLPTIMFVLAENQRKIALELEQVGAATFVASGPTSGYQVAALFKTLITGPESLSVMSKAAAGIVNGMGANSVIELLVL